MSEISDKIRCLLEFYYDKGKSASQARKKICAVYGQDTLSQTTADTWFSRFQTRNTNIGKSHNSASAKREEQEEKSPERKNSSSDEDAQIEKPKKKKLKQ